MLDILVIGTVGLERPTYSPSRTAHIFIGIFAAQSHANIRLGEVILIHVDGFLIKTMKFAVNELKMAKRNARCDRTMEGDLKGDDE